MSIAFEPCKKLLRVKPWVVWLSNANLAGYDYHP